MSKKEKIQWGIIGIIVLATAIFLLLRDGGKEEDTRIWIERPESGTRKETVALFLEETSEEWTLEVEPRERTEEEIDAAFSETIRILKEFFGVRGEEAAELSESVSLPQSIPETGVEIRWSSSDNNLVTKEGAVRREHLTAACEVQLQARMIFGKEDREHWFAVKVLPYETGSREALLYGAKEEVRSL